MSRLGFPVKAQPTAQAPGQLVKIQALKEVSEFCQIECFALKSTCPRTVGGRRGCFFPRWWQCVTSRSLWGRGPDQLTATTRRDDGGSLLKQQRLIFLVSITVKPPTSSPRPCPRRESLSTGPVTSSPGLFSGFHTHNMVTLTTAFTRAQSVVGNSESRADVALKQCCSRDCQLPSRWRPSLTSGGPPGSKDVIKGCLSLTQTWGLSSSRGTCPLTAHGAGSYALCGPEIPSDVPNGGHGPIQAKPCDQQMARAWQQA